MKRVYENDDIRVYWNSSKCFHSGICVSGLPEVFDRSRRPWVDLSAAEAAEIARLIDDCPSGALSYELLKKGKTGK
jgi:uncharacterized Fe-S cluster protein YjdI